MAEIVYRFTGGHEPDGKPSRWHEGIPARHLKQVDVDGLEPEFRDLLEISPIYTKAEKALPKRPAAKAKKAAARPTPVTEQITEQPQPDGEQVAPSTADAEGGES